MDFISQFEQMSPPLLSRSESCLPSPSPPPFQFLIDFTTISPSIKGNTLIQPFKHRLYIRINEPNTGQTVVPISTYYNDPDFIRSVISHLKIEYQLRYGYEIVPAQMSEQEDGTACFLLGKHLCEEIRSKRI